MLPQIELIVVQKVDRRMELYAGGAPVHTIAGIQLGDAPVGAKRFQGDEKTPEAAPRLTKAIPAALSLLASHRLSAALRHCICAGLGRALPNGTPIEILP